MLLLPVFHFTLAVTWFQPETEKTNLIRTFFLLNSLLNIFMFSYYSPTVWSMIVLFQCLECKLPKGVKRDLYLPFILFRQNGPWYGEKRMQLWKPLQNLSSWRRLEKLVECIFLLHWIFSLIGEFSAYIHIHINLWSYLCLMKEFYSQSGLIIFWNYY